MSEGAVPASQGAATRAVWLTRPEGQVEPLRRALREKDREVFHLPLIGIEPLPADAAIRKIVLDLDRYDLLFYVSTNAVRHGMEVIGDYWPQYPSHILNFCVGPGTARALEDFGLEAHYPEEGTNSEALLALPVLADVRGKKTLIVRGRGGRELLAGELRAGGAEVDYLEVYKRQVPHYEAQFLRDSLRRHPPGVVVITSAEGLENFVKLLEPVWAEFRNVELLVPSERIAEAARSKGFSRVKTMKGASDEAILQALDSAVM